MLPAVSNIWTFHKLQRLLEKRLSWFLGKWFKKLPFHCRKWSQHSDHLESRYPTSAHEMENRPGTFWGSLQTRRTHEHYFRRQYVQTLILVSTNSNKKWLKLSSTSSMIWVESGTNWASMRCSRHLSWWVNRLASLLHYSWTERINFREISSSWKSPSWYLSQMSGKTLWLPCRSVYLQAFMLGGNELVNSRLKLRNWMKLLCQELNSTKLAL